MEKKGAVDLEKAHARPYSEKWKRVDRLARELGAREGDATVCAVLADIGGMSAVTYFAGRGSLSPMRAGELCGLFCADLMEPFVRDGIADFLTGFSRVGFGREFGHYLKNMED